MNRIWKIVIILIITVIIIISVFTGIIIIFVIVVVVVTWITEGIKVSVNKKAVSSAGKQLGIDFKENIPVTTQKPVEYPKIQTEEEIFIEDKKE